MFTMRIFWATGFQYHWMALLALISEQRRQEFKRATFEKVKYDKEKRNAILRWIFDDTFVSTAIFGKRVTAGRFLARAGVAVRVARCQRAIIGFVFILYQIFTIEGAIVSHVYGANEWSYGQMAVIVLTAPAVMEVFRLLV
jgi:hypothetical protein